MTPPVPAAQSAPGNRPGRRAGSDRQRSAVYAAEEQVAHLLERADRFPIVEVAGSHITLPIERRFADIASAQRYVAAVLDLRAVRADWPAAARPVTVRARRGAARAHYEFATATIALPLGDTRDRWALRELVLLHEIAHHLGNTGPGNTGPSNTGSAGAGANATVAGATGSGAPRAAGAGRPSRGAATDPPAASPAARPDTGHGPGFTGRMISLTEQVMGPEVGILLRVMFADQGAAIG